MTPVVPVRVQVHAPGREPFDIIWPTGMGMPRSDDTIVIVEQDIAGRVFNVNWYLTQDDGWIVTIQLRA